MKITCQEDMGNVVLNPFKWDTHTNNQSYNKGMSGWKIQQCK